MSFEPKIVDNAILVGESPSGTPWTVKRRENETDEQMIERAIARREKLDKFREKAHKAIHGLVRIENGLNPSQMNDVREVAELVASEMGEEINAGPHFIESKRIIMDRVYERLQMRAEPFREAIKQKRKEGGQRANAQNEKKEFRKHMRFASLVRSLSRSGKPAKQEHPEIQRRMNAVQED